MPDAEMSNRLRTTVNDALLHTSRYLSDRSEIVFGLYFAALWLSFVAYQLASPIVLGDTDMWYHLSGGRFFWTTGEIPDTPYFSFIEPTREWTAYFWGFQALIFPVFENAGYLGLVLLRSTLFALSLAAVARYVRLANSNRWSWAAILILIGYFLLLEGRGYQLRPHLISYALIPTFLVILEFRRKWLPALPILTIIWANLHGVEWVVGAAIVGAYFLETLIKSVQTRDPLPTRQFLWMGACFPALFLNPFGWEILLVPFITPDGLNEFIAELAPLPIDAFFSVGLGINQVTKTTLLTGVVLASLAAAAYQILNGKVRISHWLLAVCGYILVTRGNRFVSEWILLALPLIASVIPAIRVKTPSPQWTPIPAAIALSILITPSAILYGKLTASERSYPFHAQGLPIGITDYLSQAHAQGNLLIEPSFGGYINWRLTPAVKIHSDMEFPPFTALDNLEARLVLSGNKSAIRHFQKKYDLDFLALSLEQKSAGTRLATEMGMVPIFFDDAFVLYANPKTQPDIAKKALKAINPYNLLDNFGNKEAHLISLQKLYEDWPDGQRLNHVLARLLMEKGSLTEAEKIAQHFAKLYPNDPNSYYILGNIAERNNKHDKAIEYYQQSMRSSEQDFQLKLHVHIGANHYLSKRFDAAYDAFRKGINSHRNIEDPETLFQYAFSAAALGKYNQAQRLLTALLWITEEKDDSATRHKAIGLLESITKE